MKKISQTLLLVVLTIVISCSKDDTVAEKAIFKINVNSKDFGDVIVNRDSDEESFTITNSGNADLKINDISISGANASEFSTDVSATTIAPSKTYTFKTTSSPTSLGNKVAEMVIKTSVGEQKIALSSNATTPVPETGLISFYDFSGNANDVKGSINGTANSKATLAKDRFNKVNNAYKIADGGAIDLGKQDFFSGADKKFSVSAWINPTKNATGKVYNVIGAYSDPYGTCGGSHKEFYISTYNDIVRVVYYKEGGSNTIYRGVHSSKKVKLNEWTNVVVSYDGSIDTNSGKDRIKIYINGVLDSGSTLTTDRPGSFPFDIKNTETHVSIGEFVNNAGQVCPTGKRFPFLGSLDDVAIYNKVVTQAEVTKIAADK